ncbi:unnamed protein product, partial [Mesorhabditis belari]|uniref:Uncharacterized protein n=1 Tax=Mesorhabditis belari TaxID=2138241 RepID=A0AAF3J449_9BILA
MFSFLTSIGEPTIWRKFHDLIIVLCILFGLLGIYALLTFIYLQDWSFFENAPDISENLETTLDTILVIMTDCVTCLSLITTSLAAYFAAANDRLTIPIRILASAENVNKFVWSVCYLLTFACRTEGGLFQ